MKNSAAFPILTVCVSLVRVLELRVCDSVVSDAELVSCIIGTKKLGSFGSNSSRDPVLEQKPNVLVSVVSMFDVSDCDVVAEFVWLSEVEDLVSLAVAVTCKRKHCDCIN